MRLRNLIRINYGNQLNNKDKSTNVAMIDFSQATIMDQLCMIIYLYFGQFPTNCA